MLKKVFLTSLILAICSCGFQVIYKDREKNINVSYVEDLAAIRIKKDRTKLSQDLKNSLYDLFNPDYIKADPKYFLIINASQSLSSTFTTSTGSSGRNKVILSVSYELKNIETAQTISTGVTSVNDNYDVTTNRYGTYSAEQYIQSNLSKVAAQNIRNSLVNDFIEIRKKCAGIGLKEGEEFTCPLSATKLDPAKKDTTTNKKSLPKKPLKKSKPAV